MDRKRKRDILIFVVFLALFIPLMVWLRFSRDEDPAATIEDRRKGNGDACSGNGDCVSRACYEDVCVRTCTTDEDCKRGTCVQAELQVDGQGKAVTGVCAP